jgi:RNA polymerase sporulation-specific sigma factor
MDFAAALAKTDFADLFDRLAAYAAQRLCDVDIRAMEGKEPADLVADLFVKVLTGQRNADTATCTLEEFLFGCLRSDIDAFFRKNKIQWLPIIDAFGELDRAFDNVEKNDAAAARAIHALRNLGANDEEINVFILWMDGIRKPQEVGTELGLPVSFIYRIQRRLLNRLKKMPDRSTTPL